MADWQVEESRVRALLGDQANLTPEAQAAQSSLWTNPAPDPNYGAPNPDGSPNVPYGSYFQTPTGQPLGAHDPNQPSTQMMMPVTQLSAMMQDANQRGDVAAFQAARQQYMAATGGIVPEWARNTTPEQVASNAPHANDPYNIAFNQQQQAAPAPAGPASGGPSGQPNPNITLPANMPPPRSMTLGSPGRNVRDPNPTPPAWDVAAGYSIPTQGRGAGVTTSKDGGYALRPPGAGLSGAGYSPIAPGPEGSVIGGGRTDQSRGVNPADGSRVPPGGAPPPVGGDGSTAQPYPISPGTPRGDGMPPTTRSGGPPAVQPGPAGAVLQPPPATPTNAPGTPGGGAIYQPPSYPGGTGGAGGSGGTGGAGGSSGLPGYGAGYKPPQFNPNAGLDPLYYGYQIGAAGNPSLSYIPDLTTNDPNRIYRNAQNVSYNYGAGNSAQIQSQQDQQAGLYNGYGNAANDAYSALNQTPGYTDSEANNITREGDYRSGMTTDAEYAGLGPTGAETAGMAGDTGSYGDYFDPQRFNDINQGNKNQQYANLDRTSGAQDSAIGGLSHSYDTSIDPNNLRASGEYQRQAGMTDAEVEQMVNAASRNIGLGTQAQVTDMERRAAAAGTTSPLAIGALRSRMQQQGQVNSADAVVNARLAAREAQRGAATGVEKTRLGAEQSLTGYQTEAAKNLANTQIGAAQFQGQLTKAAQDQLAGNELNSQQYLTTTGGALRQAQDKANADRAAQQYGIRQANTQYGQQNKYNQGMGVNNALSTNYAKVAGERIAGQDKYRGYLTGQQTQALGAGQTAQGQQLQNYNAMMGGMNANAGQWGNYTLGKSAQPSGFSDVLGDIDKLGQIIGRGNPTQPAK